MINYNNPRYLAINALIIAGYCKTEDEDVDLYNINMINYETQLYLSNLNYPI